MKRYIALLRGINISGKNKVSMNELKIELEKYYDNVSTYLNSGNIIFDSSILDKENIKKTIEKVILEKLNISIPVFIISKEELIELLNNQPKWWGLEDKKIYDNIIFIIYPSTYEEIYSVLLNPNDNLEKIKEYKNNIFWSYNLENYRKTNWWSRTANTSISNKITIRTANTIKKLLELCNK